MIQVPLGIARAFVIANRRRIVVHLVHQLNIGLPIGGLGQGVPTIHKIPQIHRDHCLPPVFNLLFPLVKVTANFGPVFQMGMQVVGMN